MRHLSLCLSFLALGGLATAQDLEPNLQRAAARLAGCVVAWAPSLDPSPRALLLRPREGVGREVLGAVTQALVGQGFTVRLGEGEDTEGLVALDLERHPGAGEPVIRLTAGEAGPRWTCAYGNADWLDEAAGGALVVESGFHGTRAEAVDAAFEKAWRRLRVRYDAPSPAPRSPPGLRRAAQRLYLSSAESLDGTRVFRAHLRLEDPASLEHLLRRELDSEHCRERRRGWSPLLRAGASLLVVLLLSAGYLGSDLRTRGYLSRSLRLIFGILMVLGVLACWRVSL